MHITVIAIVFKTFVHYYVDMYVARASWPSSNGKSYQSIYLRESYRDGPHVRKRTSPTSPIATPKRSPPSNSLSASKTTSPRSAPSTRSGCPKASP